MKYLVYIIIFYFFSGIIWATEKDLSYLGFYSEPEEIITNFSAEEKLSYSEHFILGLAYKELKDYKKAIFHFANSCFQSYQNQSLTLYPKPIYKHVNKLFCFRSEFYDDALYQLASLFYLYQEYNYTLEFINLISDQQQGLFINGVLLKAKALVALKKYSLALKTLDSINYGNTSAEYLIKIRKASVLDRMEKSSEALEVYFKIIEKNYKNWEAAIAADQLYKIIKKENKKISGERSLLLGQALYQAKKYSEAVFVLKEIKILPKEDQERRQDYLLRSLVRLKKITEIDEIFSKISTRDPFFYISKGMEANEWWESGNKKKSLGIYKNILKNSEIISKNLQKESLKKMALYSADYHHKNWQEDLKEYIEKYPTDFNSELFLWLLAKDKIKQGDETEAILFLEKGLANFPQGDYKAAFLFWLYKIYKKNKQFSKADFKMKELVVDNFSSYYTWALLAERGEDLNISFLEQEYQQAFKNNNYQDLLFYHTLLFFKEQDFKKRNRRIEQIFSFSKEGQKFFKLDSQLSPAKLSEKYQKIFKQVKKYFRIGYKEGLARELNIVSEKEEKLDEKNIILILGGDKYHYPYYSLYNLLDFLKFKKIDENLALMSEKIVKLIYPKAFKNHVASMSEKYNLEDNLLYAIIRAESYFHHQAVSSAKAKGLMQLMPKTAAEIAKNLGLKNYNLKKPSDSILLGASYVNWLKKYFKSNFEYMVSAYNAGMGNVNKWRRKRKWPDLDYYTEFIPFDETRNYVYKTRKNFLVYDLLY